MHTGVFKKNYLGWITELALDRLPEDLDELKKLPNLETLILPQAMAQERAAELTEAGYTVVIALEESGEEASP